MAITPRTLAQHADFVRALARSLVSDAHAADDVSQDTWLAALERPPRHEAQLGAWLRRIVERLAWRRGRTVDRRRQREAAVARPERLEPVDETLARSELLRHVTDAVLALEEPGTVRVVVEEHTTQGGFHSVSFLQLDDDGRARWVADGGLAQAGAGVRLHPGRYLLRTTGATGVANEQLAFELSAGELRTLTLATRPGRRVSPGIEVPQGTPLPHRVRFELWDSEGNSLLAESLTAVNGRLLGPQLAPGIYTLEARSSSGCRCEYGVGAVKLRNQVHLRRVRRERVPDRRALARTRRR